MYKEIYQSRTIAFFTTVLAVGGLDIIKNLIEQQTIGWRDVALATVAIVGIALRIVTDKPIKF